MGGTTWITTVISDQKVPVSEYEKYDTLRDNASIGTAVIVIDLTDG